MWWIVLILIMASMVVLLWWRNVQERSWQREITYLTRHENYGMVNNHLAQTQQTASQLADAVPDHEPVSIYQNQLNETEDNKLVAEHNQSQNLKHDIVQRKDNIIVDQLSTAPQFATVGDDIGTAPQVTVTESAPLPQRPNLQAEQPISDYQVSTPLMQEPIEKKSFRSEEYVIKTDYDDTSKEAASWSNPIDTTSKDIGAINQTEAEIRVAEVEQQKAQNFSVANSDEVDESLPVITLEEATRRMANPSKVEIDNDDDPAELEVIQLSWQQKQQLHRKINPRHRINEIRPDDPMLIKVRSRTQAEQEVLLKERALKNFDPQELEQATQHSLGQITSSPSHLANMTFVRNLPVAPDRNKQIIDEEDIKINLLRQRLARLRQHNNDYDSTNVSSVPVIADEEVFSNLAKTDSPINKKKFKRPMVRASVIPAAARIGEQQAVQLMVPTSEVHHSSTVSEMPMGRDMPLSTRFTPFQTLPEAYKPTVEVVGSTYDHESNEDIFLQSSEDKLARSMHTTLQDSEQPIIHTNPVDPHYRKGEVETSSIYPAPMQMPYADILLPNSEQVQQINNLHSNDSTTAVVTESLRVVDDSIHNDAHIADQSTIRTEQRSVNLTSPFQYIEDAEEYPSSTSAPIWNFTADEVETELVSAEIAFSAGNIAHQLKNEAHSTGTNLNMGINPNQPHSVVSEAANLSQDVNKPAQLSTAVNNQPNAADSYRALQPAMHLKPMLPGMDLLLPAYFDSAAQQSEETLLENGITIEEKLAEFKVKVKVIDAFAGPVITRYEIEPAQGVRGSQVVNLEKDLARSLGFASIRIVETIPGKTCMGIELPNPKRQIIRLSEIFSAPVFQQSHSKLTLALGQGITGQPIVTDLAKAPHLLVAGTTGSGKSVGVNAMILSMLFKATPDDVRLIMIDPKMLELSIYEGIPHLLAPVVTDMKLAANALTWCVNEMEKRYRLMSHAGVRNLAGFNQKIMELAKHGQKLANPFSLNPNEPEPLEKLPYIVVVVDEFADLMMTAGKKIEELIARLAQKARAAGIHLILATQRPSVDVITGLIKANIPTRIAFQVSSKVDSRTILDQMGAENLLGQGDMLFLPPGTAYPERVHGAFVADEEVHRVVNYLKQFGQPQYIDDILTAGVGDDDIFSNASSSRSVDDDQDPLYDDAVALVVKTRKASISSVQRHLRIGYNRAARLVEQMEADGVVSAPEGNGNRTVLAPQNNHLDG
jgi:DNA segregation ATPase FtsK/SpoIIIE, S-DNA-T family